MNGADANPDGFRRDEHHVGSRCGGLAGDAFIPSCLQDAALQCRKELASCLEDREELLKQLLDWAFGGFKPVGPDTVPPAVGGESPLP